MGTAHSMCSNRRPAPSRNQDAGIGAFATLEASRGHLCPGFARRAWAAKRASQTRPPELRSRKKEEPANLLQAAGIWWDVRIRIADRLPAKQFHSCGTRREPMTSLDFAAPPFSLFHGPDETPDGATPNADLREPWRWLRRPAAALSGSVAAAIERHPGAQVTESLPTPRPTLWPSSRRSRCDVGFRTNDSLLAVLTVFRPKALDL
jgi:hypothetical protein